MRWHKSFDATKYSPPDSVICWFSLSSSFLCNSLCISTFTIFMKSHYTVVIPCSISKTENRMFCLGLVQIHRNLVHFLSFSESWFLESRPSGSLTSYRLFKTHSNQKEGYNVKTVNNLLKPFTSRSRLWSNLSEHIKKLQIAAILPSHLTRFSYLGLH